MITIKLEMGDEIAFAKLDLGAKVERLKNQLDVYLIEHDMFGNTYKSIVVNPITCVVQLESF